MSKENNKNNTLQPWWQKMIMSAAIAENPSAMIASGHKIESDGSVSIDNYNDPGVTHLRETALPTALKVGLIGGAGLYGIATYGLPSVLSWSAKNIALPTLGGEVVNEITRKLSNNKYNTFGNFVYNNTPISKLKDGTDDNKYVKLFSEIMNPAYLVNYGKFVNLNTNGIKTNVSSILDDLNSALKYAQHKGFLTPSEGIPRNSLGLNLFWFNRPAANYAKNMDDLLSLPEINKVVDVHLKGVKPGQLSYRELEKIAQSDKATDNLIKELIQSRFQVYRGSTNIRNHKLNEFANFQEGIANSGNGGQRLGLNGLYFDDINNGALYTTNSPSDAVKFAINKETKKVPAEGGIGIIKLKDANFSGSRKEWISNPENSSPLLTRYSSEDDLFTILNNVQGKKTNFSNHNWYIFKGTNGNTLGEIIKIYNPIESQRFLVPHTIYDKSVAHWKCGGKLNKK